MTKVAALIVTAVLSFGASAADFFDREFTLEVTQTPVDLVTTRIRVGSFDARRSDRATVIYLHGFADTYDNHEAMLTSLHRAGMRVISYDYPGHGKSTGALWAWDIKRVAGIVREILNSREFTEGPNAVNRRLPVILAGWSTGATIAIRTAQSWGSDVVPEDMHLAGVIAIAPAMIASPIVGNGWSRLGMWVKPEDLTRNPRAIKYGPRPSTTVLEAGWFVLSLERASIAAKVGDHPQIPTLVLLADNDKDFFSFPGMAKGWIESAGAGNPVFGYQCPGGYHGLEFEPDGIGALTLRLSTEFAESVVRGTTESFRTRSYQACPAIHTDY